MAGWIKVPLGMQVGLGPGDFVLDGDPATPSQIGGGAPNFRPMSHRPKIGGSAGPPPIWETMSIVVKRLPRNFRPICIVAKWVDGSRCHLV